MARAISAFTDYPSRPHSIKRRIETYTRQALPGVLRKTSRPHSIKRRIETKMNTIQTVNAIAPQDHIPLKEGLKQQK